MLGRVVANEFIPIMDLDSAKCQLFFCYDDIGLMEAVMGLTFLLVIIYRIKLYTV